MRAIGVIAAVLLAGQTTAQSAQEVAVAKHVLNQAQIRSTAENREYCGYIGYTKTGALASTRPMRGQQDECTPRWPKSLDVIASWHTHAAYDEDAYSEVPTVNDIEADEAEGVDGYVGTPGGRLWFVDTTDMIVSQLCGLRCLRSDPDFVKGAEGRIDQSYTYRELLRREAE
ncbi:MAG: DUF4329 domain-containing protein [Pseudomonadota bacterium]